MGSFRIKFFKVGFCLNCLALYCNIIYPKGTPLENYFGFVDGTVLRISRPKITSEYTVSSLNVWLYLMESLVNLVALMWENAMIVPCNTSLGCSQIYRDQYWHNNQPLCIYGDPAYSLSIHLQALFSWQNLTPDPVNYNKATSQTQVNVEYLFHKIKISFKFVSLKSWMKIGLSAIDKIYRICTLLHNPRTCFMGIKFLSFQLIYLGQLALLCYNV